MSTPAAGRDVFPVPIDTLHVRMPEVGTRGGRFVVAQTNAPRTFNAMMASDGPTLLVTNRLFDGLVGFDNVTQQQLPSLAKSWEKSADGLTWTFHLRRGACFSDGHPITSADVLFSFEVCYDPALHPARQDLLLVRGRRMEVAAPDSYTVVVRLPERFALALPAIGTVCVMPKHVLERPYREGRFASAYDVGTKPESLVTSGAFRLEQYVPNEKVVLSPNPYWYGVDPRGQRLPYLDELVFRIVPDLNTAALQFEAGNVDALDDVDAADYRRYAENQRKGDYRLYDLGPALSGAYMTFNLNRAREARGGRQAGDPWVGATKYSWFSDPVFRRAVSHAIDRDALIRANHGEAVKNWSMSTVADKVWYTPEITGADYDPAESRRLLASLGFRDHDGDGVLEDTRGNPVSFTLKTLSASAPLMKGSLLIQEDLAKVGIRCVPVGVEFGSLAANLLGDFQFDAVLFGFQAGSPPDPGMNQSLYKSSGIQHTWNVRQPKPETRAEAEIDSLLALNLSTDDMVVRKRTWSDIEQIMNRECFLIWLPTPRMKVPIRNGFGNVEPSVIPSRILWNAEAIFVRHAGASRTALGRRGARGPP